MQSKQAVADTMESEKQAIRDMVNTWLEASKQGDSETLLKLVADDVLFITPGREPFGKEVFAAEQDPAKEMKMDAEIDFKEIEVEGSWAWMRSFLKLTFTPEAGNPANLSGHILTILQKGPEGNWVIKRDANFVQPEQSDD